MRQMLTNHWIVGFQISALVKLHVFMFHKFGDVHQHVHKDQKGWFYSLNDGKERDLGVNTLFLVNDMYEYWYGLKRGWHVLINLGCVAWTGWFFRQTWLQWRNTSYDDTQLKFTNFLSISGRINHDILLWRITSFVSCNLPMMPTGKLVLL